MKLSNLIKIVLVVVILSLSFLLRYKNFSQVPVAGISMDEYSYSYVGLSLIKDHYPVGISGIDGYKKNEQRYVNPDDLLHIAVSGPFVFNYPWFDHPPLLGLITGGYSYFKGARNFEDIQLYIIRQPMIILGTLGVFLVFLFGYINFGYISAIVAMTIYGTAPLSVVGSRMVQGENGMIIPFLFSLIFISWYLKNKKNIFLILASCMAGIAILFKLSGIVAVLSIVGLIFFSNSKNKGEKLLDIFTVVIISFLFLSLFFIYGYYFDWDVFRNVFFSNSNRFYGIGSNSIFNLITQTKLTGDINIIDAWVLIGWICVFFNLIIKKNKQIFLIIPLISYLIIYIFFGSYSYGWYAFPFLPFLAINIGYQFNVIVQNNRLTTGLLLGLIVIGSGISSIISTDKFQNYSKMWRIGLPVLIISTLIFNYTKLGKNKISKYFLIFLFLIGIILNIIFLKNFNADTWYAKIW